MPHPSSLSLAASSKKKLTLTLTLFRSLVAHGSWQVAASTTSLLRHHQQCPPSLSLVASSTKIPLSLSRTLSFTLARGSINDNIIPLVEPRSLYLLSLSLSTLHSLPRGIYLTLKKLEITIYSYVKATCEVLIESLGGGVRIICAGTVVDIQRSCCFHV